MSRNFYNLNSKQFSARRQVLIVDIILASRFLIIKCVIFGRKIVLPSIERIPWRMVAVVTECALFVTSQYDFIFTFPKLTVWRSFFTHVHIILRALSFNVCVTVFITPISAPSQDTGAKCIQFVTEKYRAARQNRAFKHTHWYVSTI